MCHYFGTKCLATMVQVCFNRVVTPACRSKSLPDGKISATGIASVCLFACCEVAQRVPLQRRMKKSSSDQLLMPLDVNFPATQNHTLENQVPVNPRQPISHDGSVPIGSGLSVAPLDYTWFQALDNQALDNQDDVQEDWGFHFLAAALRSKQV